MTHIDQLHPKTQFVDPQTGELTVAAFRFLNQTRERLGGPSDAISDTQNGELYEPGITDSQLVELKKKVEELEILLDLNQPTNIEQLKNDISALEVDFETFHPTDREEMLKNWDLEVKRGNIPGISSVNKFGKALDCDNGTATDVWDGADGTTSTDVWVAPTQARTHTIVSTDIDDSDTGGVNPQSTGMRTVQVYGLEDWDSAETSEVITLDGTTGVVTSNSYVIIHRMKGLTFGSTGSNEGIITATATTDATVTAAIQAGEGQTLMAIYGIPSTQKMYINYIHAGILRAVASVTADLTLLVEENVDQSDSGFITKEEFILTSSVPVHRPYKTYKTVTGPAIVKLQVTTGANDADVTAAFDAYLVDN